MSRSWFNVEKVDSLICEEIWNGDSITFVTQTKCYAE